MKLRTSLILAGMLLVLSSCATRALNGRGQANLDDWDSSLVYDPVTKRSYHTQTPPTAQEVIHQDSLRPLTED